MKRISIVIARYQEDVNWIKDVVDLLKANYECEVAVYIYNKGKDALDQSIDCTLTQLPNVGRESHSYLYHIIDQYDQVDDNDHYVLFLQGRLKDHIQLHNQRDEGNLVLSFLKDAESHGGANITTAQKHEYVGGNTAHWFFRIASHNGKHLYPRAKSCFGEWFSSNVDQKGFRTKFDKLPWWISGLFCVTWKLLKQHQKEYYEYLIDYLRDIDPEVGHYFERSWVYITNAHTLLAQEVDTASMRLIAKSRNGSIL